MHTGLTNPVCITRSKSAFWIDKSENTFVKKMKMKLVMDEKDVGDDNMKVRKNVRVKKEKKYLEFLIYFIME